MSMFSRRDPQMPAELGEIKARPPVEYEPPDLREDGTSRDAVIQAAREHDRQQRRIADLEDLLNRAKAEVEAAAHQIGELKLQLAEERNHVSSYKAERDEAIQDRANCVAILANISAILEHGISTGDIPRKRRNGKNTASAGAGSVVFDAGGGGATSSAAADERLPDQGGS